MCPEEKAGSLAVSNLMEEKLIKSSKWSLQGEDKLVRGQLVLSSALGFVIFENMKLARKAPASGYVWGLGIRASESRWVGVPRPGSPPLGAGVSVNLSRAGQPIMGAFGRRHSAKGPALS